MVWQPGDPVIALRRGGDVDPESIEIRATGSIALLNGRARLSVQLRLR